VPADVSEPLRHLVRERLPSLEQIHIVLLLRGDRTRSWSAPEVSERLATPPESTAMRLFLLASNGVIAFEGGRYRYAADAATESLFDELAAAPPDALISLVGGQPADPLRSFADAFKWKK
jgi:hypothetical protein